MSTDLLNRIQQPADLKALDRRELKKLADELRAFILQSVSRTGGHLSSNLGTVELTVALHHVYDTPHDRIIWDVGHQSYPHKILTGRKDAMASLRQFGGISGFPKRSESEYDAFGTAHREHASTATMARFFGENKAAGFLMAAELNNADKVIKHADRPFTAIMGGAKVSDKILIIENLLDKVDNLLIGGGMVFTFFKAMGGQIGNSLCEDDKLELALQLIEKAKAKGVNLVLPVDSVVADAFSNDANTKIADNNAIEAGWMGLDLGPKAIAQFTEVIANSKTLLWNGPAGVFEMPKFEAGTKAAAQAIVAATKKGAFSLIGGGDSAAAINQFGLADEVSYVSTGGGALLEYMEGKVLPGVAALA